MRTSAPDPPEPRDLPVGDWLEPPVPVGAGVAPYLAGTAVEDSAAHGPSRQPDSGPVSDPNLMPGPGLISDPAWASDPHAVSDPNLTLDSVEVGGYPPADTGPFPTARDYGLLQTPPLSDPLEGGNLDYPYGGYERSSRAGRHLSAQRVRPGWTVAPGWLAVAALVLFIAAVIGNAGMQRSGGGQPEEARERAAQAAPADPEDAAQGSPEGAEAPTANRPPAQLTVLESVNGEALGDVASYADGTAGWVLETGHTDAGGGLAEVTVKVKLVNMGGKPVDVRTARVELTFAGQSSRATRVARSELGTVAPNGGETVGDWVFRMPANQLRDVSVTLAPTDRHEPATFHGAAS